ncbi:MAG: ABC transporter substrate-binding protein, partial [Proteobacteria bacterium]|nr:ABC transporter substrate-binding protein [Pseudomonadota bacterium]
MFKTLGVLAGVAVLGFTLAGPAPTALAQGSENVVRIGTDVDAGTLDPRIMRDTTAYRAINLIYDGLVQLDENLQPVPDLAVSWENPDPKTWIFHLREGVKFHDGTPVTAADVKFTLDTIRDPALKARFRSLYAPIDTVEAVDNLTVKITLKEPYAPLLSYLDLGIVPKHAVEAGADISNNPIGSGPYRLVK